MKNIQISKMKNKDKCTPAWMHYPNVYRVKEKRLNQAFDRYMNSLGFLTTTAK